jgi:hypothetical protein
MYKFNTFHVQVKYLQMQKEKDEVDEIILFS